MNYLKISLDVHNPGDAHYFDKEFTKRDPRDSPAVPATANTNKLFRGFSFSRGSREQVTKDDDTQTKSKRLIFSNLKSPGSSLSTIKIFSLIFSQRRKFFLIFL